MRVLQGLIARRIRLNQHGQIKFSQSSFLHLFAARRAVESRDFRIYLCEDPLFFPPIIQHYAALARNDVVY